MADDTSTFEPEIIVFACHYCAYAAADLAGSMRLQYPSNIRMIKLPCTGKLEVIHLLRAIEAGADGVSAAGAGLDGPQQMDHLELAGAGQLDHADVARVLQAHAAGQVGRRVGAVVAGEHDDLGLEGGGVVRHLSSPP